MEKDSTTNAVKWFMMSGKSITRPPFTMIFFDMLSEYIFLLNKTYNRYLIEINFQFITLIDDTLTK